MDETGVTPIDAILPTTLTEDPLRLLEMTVTGAKFLEPIVGHLAKAIVSAAKEKRLEIEARLATRLKELADAFSKLEVARIAQVADRDFQFRALSVLLELAKVSGDPVLVASAMDAFKEYVRATPSFTRDFTEALSAIDSRVELFPPGDSDT